MAASASILVVGIVLVLAATIVIRYVVNIRKTKKPDHFDEYLTHLMNNNDDWKP